MSSPTNLARRTLLSRKALNPSSVYTISGISSSSRCLYGIPVLSRGSHSHASLGKASNTRFDPRWLSRIKTRIGKCIAFGMKQELVPVAGGVLEEIAQDWRELVAGHVNNVMYVRYAETGRINWSRNIALYHDPENSEQWSQLGGSTSIGYILKSIKVDFKFAMMFPDQICVYHKLANEPPVPGDPNPAPFSNLHLDVMILSEAKQRPAARCEEDVVLYDYRIAKKLTSLPSWMLVQYRKLWEAQEMAKKENRAKVQDIERRVRELEVGTWDREGAVESMGSAASS
ncbi:hypothetical protein MferCBS31731_007562 [Microsporum ferrugineum]